VIDFNDIREVVKTWIDTNLDHRMLLHRGDPLVPILEGLGEPLYLMDGNPTAENIARLVFEEARRQGLAAVEVRLWETPSACAIYRPGGD
jgi:6-pyruvoyltetrahydropterin/6-carboxytetrahydropterin synthase